MKIKEIKKKKGISLIVLIITIAVIIILASAVILSIANNRPIGSAKEATEKHNKATLKESAAVLSAQWEVDRLLDDSIGTRSEYVMQGLSNQGFTAEERETVAVDEKTGKVTVGGAAEEVASNPQKYYGATIDYKENSGSGVGWKILYSDGNNIYLIADDYIPYSAVPKTSNGHKPNEITSGSVSYECDIDFTGILTDYKGSSDITDKKMQNLNSLYYAYLSSNNEKSENINMKVVAYMLDTNVWKNYASDKAEYAIGGPSLELIVKSYNQKYLEANIKFQIKDGTFVTDYSNRTGSVLAINGYSWSNKEGIWGTYFNNNIFNVSDNLYVISSIQKARGMWLSSPSGESTDCLVGIGSGNDGGGMMGVSYNAGGYGSPNQSYGLRPVVCLKSNVKLEEQSDNKYTIK